MRDYLSKSPYPRVFELCRIGWGSTQPLRMPILCFGHLVSSLPNLLRNPLKDWILTSSILCSII